MIAGSETKAIRGGSNVHDFMGLHNRDYSLESAESYESGPVKANHQLNSSNKKHHHQNNISMTQSKGNSFRRRAIISGSTPGKQRLQQQNLMPQNSINSVQVSNQKAHRGYRI